MDKLETAARAKIFWGESPESVIAYLQAEGATPEEARTITESMQRERTASIKSSGMGKMVTGFLLCLVPVGAYVLFSGARRFPLHLFGAAVAVGVFGVWRFINGTMNFFFPHLERGDLADADQDDD